jgi:hypothetical protein
MKNTEVLTQNRWDNMAHLQETCSRFDDGQALLEEVVAAMSNEEFHQIYLYICRNWDIEPDHDKFAEGLALGLDTSK